MSISSFFPLFWWFYLNELLPLADEAAELVGGHVEAVEVAQNCLALNVLGDKADLAVAVLLVGGQISQARLENAALESLRGNLCSREQQRFKNVS